VSPLSMTADAHASMRIFLVDNNKQYKLNKIQTIIVAQTKNAGNSIQI